MVALLLGTGLSTPAQYAGTNGIFAEFYTSMGNYTCRLDFVAAPKTVANFIGHATGERAWLDESAGIVRTNPLHSGTIFHRVVSNFVNQAGAPGALPSGGPGYDFVDEFSPSLRHDRFGVLSMANTGPDSNGSQYFITVAPRPDLDDKYSVFGRLYGGSNVVYAINRVPTVSERPVTDITINSIAIRRIGAAALAFDIHTNGLPVVTNLNLKIAKLGTNVSLSFSNRLNVDNRIYDSINLTNWNENQLGIEVAEPVSGAVTFPNSGGGKFFRAAQIQYASSTFAPKTVYNRTLTLVVTNGGAITFTLLFDSSGGGTYTLGTSSGSILGYAWRQAAYNGRLHPIIFTGTYDTTLALNFETPFAGGFTGVQYPFGYPISFGAATFSGSFTISP